MSPLPPPTFCAGGVHRRPLHQLARPARSTRAWAHGQSWWTCRLRVAGGGRKADPKATARYVLPGGFVRKRCARIARRPRARRAARWRTSRATTAWPTLTPRGSSRRTRATTLVEEEVMPSQLRIEGPHRAPRAGGSLRPTPSPPGLGALGLGEVALACLDVEGLLLPSGPSLRPHPVRTFTSVPEQLSSVCRWVPRTVAAASRGPSWRSEQEGPWQCGRRRLGAGGRRGLAAARGRYRGPDAKMLASSPVSCSCVIGSLGACLLHHEHALVEGAAVGSCPSDPAADVMRHSPPSWCRSWCPRGIDFRAGGRGSCELTGARQLHGRGSLGGLFHVHLSCRPSGGAAEGVRKPSMSTGRGPERSRVRDRQR